MTVRHSPRAPERPQRASLDNPILLPGDLLAMQALYQDLANTLRPGTTLIVLPEPGHPQRDALERVAETMRAKGRAVTTVVSDGELHQQQLF